MGTAGGQVLSPSEVVKDMSVVFTENGNVIPTFKPRSELVHGRCA